MDTQADNGDGQGCAEAGIGPGDPSDPATDQNRGPGYNVNCGEACDPENIQIQQLAQGVTAQAGWIGTPQGVAEFYGASLVGATGVFVVSDIAAVEEGVLFGTRYGGNTPKFNSNDSLRIGWSYIRASDEYVFRIGGQVLTDLGLENPHINLWPPSWWNGPPTP